ncbi:hypothetical protein ZOSMA_118G00510 [Zostera marina]|uniref:DUF4283 domain-containing protein n=1 Tax=Zostera marina TaxID=29655 RepID=A0A0K9Q1L6_ZOSMR|nr:hypothetical protein ZOSMA_118G00510 [Zostera marina]
MVPQLLQIKGLPSYLSTEEAIGRVTSALGTPLTAKVVDCSNDIPILQVCIIINKSFKYPTSIKVRMQGCTSTAEDIKINIHYMGRKPFCSKCIEYGHWTRKCIKNPNKLSTPWTNHMNVTTHAQPNGEVRIPVASLISEREREISNSNSSSNSRKSTYVPSRVTHRPSRQIYKMVRHQARPANQPLHITRATTEHVVGSTSHPNSVTVPPKDNQIITRSQRHVAFQPMRCHTPQPSTRQGEPIITFPESPELQDRQQMSNNTEEWADNMENINIEGHAITLEDFIA